MPAPPPSPLPPHLARRSAADIEGEVHSTSTIQIKAPKDVAGDTLKLIVALVLLPIRPLLVLAAWLFGGRKPEELQTVHIVRVDCIDGVTRQARIEQDIVGATIDRGDYISIWGENRGGVFVVTHAYNHTVRAEVLVRRRSRFLFSQLLLLTVLLSTCALCVAFSGGF